MLNYFNWAGLAGLSSLLPDFIAPTKRKIVTENFAEPNTIGYKVNFSRTFNLAPIKTSNRLRLRIPLPLSHNGLRLAACEGLDDNPVPLRLAGGGTRLEAQVPADIGATIKLQAAFALVPSTDLPEEAMACDSRYLARQEGLVAITPRIETLACALANGTTDPHVNVQRFFDYLLERFMLGAVHYDLVQHANSAPEWVLDNGWFDCQLGSAVFVSLCRAAGLHARVVCGYFLYPRKMTLHYWAEAWLPDLGWTPFDLMEWGLSLGHQDLQWRGFLAGKVDRRIITECLPDRFVGPPGVPMPAGWGLISQWFRGATISRAFCPFSGATLYRDKLAVERFDYAGNSKPDCHRVLRCGPSGGVASPREPC